ncbi:MAG TPA: HEAT repeat domain-containing protein [Pirellulales bacterium]|nr:HEAT repeat domain-containing protein [Pirellulales bacterium]
MHNRHVHWPRMRRALLRWGLIAPLVLLSALGCSQRTRKGFSWPWTPEVDDAVGITTPAQRLAAMQKQAENASKQTPEEQERITNDLAKQIQDEQDPMLRRNIVRTLGYYKTASATAVLQAAIADSDSTVRIAAAEAWGRRGDPESAERLASLLASDTNLDVRLAAVRAMGQARQIGSIQSLGEALSDADPAVQFCVISSLKQISGKDYGNDISLWRAYAKGENPAEPSVSIAERFKRMF